MLYRTLSSTFRTPRSPPVLSTAHNILNRLEKDIQHEFNSEITDVAKKSIPGIQLVQCQLQTMFTWDFADILFVQLGNCFNRNLKLDFLI
eukprot:snap_masked-scaffold_6-processed-gene-9.13-mRNA-1 protein AED:1.00 eAED:1.00 QI:0/0/0/0/1/1/2/0/89